MPRISWTEWRELQYYRCLNKNDEIAFEFPDGEKIILSFAKIFKIFGETIKNAKD